MPLLEVLKIFIVGRALTKRLFCYSQVLLSDGGHQGWITALPRCIFEGFSYCVWPSVGSVLPAVFLTEASAEDVVLYFCKPVRRLALDFDILKGPQLVLCAVADSSCRSLRKLG